MMNMNMETIFSIEFTAYVAFAFLLYAIRQASNLPNRYIPIVAAVLGVAFSILESGAFSFAVLIHGLRYALYGIGTVATIEYALEKSFDTSKAFEEDGK
jgi:hypothetical protein